MTKQPATVTEVEPTYGPMVETCAKFGIKRTWAYELADAGLIDTFRLKSRRFVMIESLRSLPMRVMEIEQKDAA